MRYLAHKCIFPPRLSTNDCTGTFFGSRSSMKAESDGLYEGAGKTVSAVKLESHDHINGLRTPIRRASPYYRRLAGRSRSPTLQDNRCCPVEAHRSIEYMGDSVINRSTHQIFPDVVTRTRCYVMDKLTTVATVGPNSDKHAHIDNSRYARGCP